MKDEVVDGVRRVTERAAAAADDLLTRCNACLTVIAAPPPGQSTSCRCGNVTVTGREGRPLRRFQVKPGAGWSTPPAPK